MQIEIEIFRRTWFVTVCVILVIAVVVYKITTKKKGKK
jgi:hypothetical protein